MEKSAEPRERTSEGEQISSSQDGVFKEISSTAVPAISPTEGTKPPERKVHPPPARFSAVVPAHHRSSHSVDRHGQSSSTSGALDLQAVIGRSGSSISGMTVPIRLDALSYLLNNAVAGAYKMPSQIPSQMPCYPHVLPGCPYSQMGCSSYNTCMNPQYCSVPFTNQVSACQPTFMPCGNQQGFQPCQYQVPNQVMGGIANNQSKSPFSSVTPQSGMAFSSNGTSSVQESIGSAQPDGNRWAKKPNDRFGSNMGNSFSLEREQQNSPSQRGFGRFGDKPNEDSCSGRQQTSFRRGRGDFGGQTWQGNSRGQDKEMRFGDRSRNMDYGGQKRFQDNPERPQDRDNFFKRGRWQGGRGGGGESRDAWQQRNRQDESSSWSNTTATQGNFNSGGEAKRTSSSDRPNAEDEDWETDYPENATTSKSGEASGKALLNASSPLPSPPKSYCAIKSSGCSQTLQPAVDSVNDEGVKSEKVIEGCVADEKEEGEIDSGSDKADVEMMEPEPQGGEQAPTPFLVVNAAEEQVESVDATSESREENVYAVTISVDGDDSKGILVEVNADSQ